MDSQIKGIEGEDFVNELAYSSFFKYWCYPSPKNENGNKKEICDLLILFNEVLIIFSVKNYEFKQNHFRYFNNTINKATNQIAGALRILFNNNEIFIKHPDKNLEKFPKEKIKKIYPIIVNLGDNVKFYPFNSLTKNQDYISIFDKESFWTIAKELDTVSDFIDYLEKREELFKDKITVILPADEFDFPVETQKEFYKLMDSNSIESTQIIISGTEKDLLAHFLKNERQFPSILKDKKANSFYLQIDGDWNKFVKNNRYKNKKVADITSYFIDQFVENELLCNISEYREKIAILLLSFNRFTRRSIAISYFDFHKNNTQKEGLFFGRRFADIDGIGILFTSYTNQMPEEMFQTLNQLAIDSFNIYTNYKSKIIILISTNHEHFFKFGLVENIKPYPKELEKKIIKDVNILGWFTKHTEEKYTIKEFPE